MTTPTVRSYAMPIPVGAASMSPLAGLPLAPPAGLRLTRWGAGALLVGGPLGLVFHVLWRTGHGPTVVNEHGVVLGLTNDRWSHLGGAWMALVALGVLAVCALHGGRLSRVAGVLTIGGLVLSALAAWVWVLYALGLLVLHGGVLCLGVTVLRGRRLPRWSGLALLGAAACFALLIGVQNVTLAASTSRVPLQVQDVIALCAAGGWVALGLGLLRRHALR